MIGSIRTMGAANEIFVYILFYIYDDDDGLVRRQRRVVNLLAT